MGSLPLPLCWLLPLLYNQHAYFISIHAKRIVFFPFYKSILFIEPLFLFVIRCDYERFIFYFLLRHNLVCCVYNLQPVMDFHKAWGYLDWWVVDIDTKNEGETVKHLRETLNKLPM
jgi:hypothetical protein